MAFEFPSDLIRQVQIALRNDAGLSSYDPLDPTLPALPSLAASIAGLDPSPPYLRCKHCKGKLLSGIQSLICVYCGKHQRKDIPPDPLAFKSTFGYQWLLESLDLDGSQTIEAPTEGNELNRGQSTPKEEISLSELLDLQIKWPDESEKPETSVTNQMLEQSKSSLNLTGINLDNFFSGSKNDAVFNASEEQPVIGKQIESTESKANAGQDNLSLFQNFLPSETADSSSKDASADAFTGWEASFQSADLGNQHESSKSVDPFIGSTVDLSAHMDSVFGHGEDLKDGKTKEDSDPPPSMINDWPQDDLWNDVNSVVSQQANQFDSTVKAKDGMSPDNSNNPSSGNVDWFQDNQWQNDITSIPKNKTINEDDDSFDEWNDFTSPAAAEDPSTNARKQTRNEIAAVNEQTSEINLFNSTKNFHEVDFGSFEQADLFSGSSSDQSGSAEPNSILPDVSTSDRTDDAKSKVTGNTEQATEIRDNFNTTTQPRDDAEILMSQMHDLSFMLETNLSVPSKLDKRNSFSQD